MNKAPTLLDRKVDYTGYLKVETLTIRVGDGVEVDRQIESHGDVVAVLPYDPDRRVALTVELLRAPVFATTGQAVIEEACAGMIDGQDSWEDTAKREAMEELGVALSELEPVAQIWASPGTRTERLWLFLASYRPADRVGVGGGLIDEHEGIEVKETNLGTLAQAADNGSIADPKLLILLAALRLRQPLLFA
jgi:nudix-type nucleoside diphosphatase (YffH/AdpP family)